MSRALMGLKHEEEITLEELAVLTDVPLEALDENYGLILVSKRRGRYAFMVDPTYVEKLKEHESILGPYANPKIETFGPPR